ncbi:hypothetical protein LHYA1_G004280 [Lachnellula hyalina]|uniref:Uncharacterized protein n=1 Tax=Lachnellula hyalina TaxID=1316788 RepID=A0A8H8R385_9HELO|nr:uncharacterized protein LHYA1_G004280 [Lachnellula hyalina]TVY26089.1 hypothetical protein LHYA1_G004280 [Lachnellula hyalina]
MSLRTYGKDETSFSTCDDNRLSGAEPLAYESTQYGNNSWIPGQLSVEELCNLVTIPKTLVIFFPEVPELATEDTQKLSGRFKVPLVFWKSLSEAASGFFGCQETRDSNGALEHFSCQFRFLIKEPVKQNPRLFYPQDGISYGWHKLAFFTYWTPSNTTLILCFGLPRCMRQSILLSHPPSLGNPFWFHVVLIENIIDLYDKTVWAWRDLVRGLEQNRTCPEDPRPDYINMHEIARHVLHSSETIAMAIETMTDITQEHKLFYKENESLSPATRVASRQTSMAFRSQVSILKCLSLRSKALEERLKNEINLVAFNTVAQHDSRIAVRIGESTQVDSASMKTISILGLVFLPGTFICALFSTSFFNFSPATSTEPQHWRVSEQFWVYWAVALPLTLVTVAGVLFWQRVYTKETLNRR